MRLPLYRSLGLLLILALTGCTSTTRITMPDGRQGFAVACTERLLTWEDCFERADEICGGHSYEIFTQAGAESAFVASEPQHLADVPAEARRLVIICK